MNTASKTGIPPVRALFLAFPDDERAYDHADDQFMVGEALLVAPVIEQDKSSRSVNLPGTVASKVCASRIAAGSVSPN